MDLNKRFTELVGLCWHELEKMPSGTTIQYFRDGCVYPIYRCIKCELERRKFYWYDFISDPRLVLVEMKKKGPRRFNKFLEFLTGDLASPERELFAAYILDTTGLLVKAGIACLEKETGK